MDLITVYDGWRLISREERMDISEAAQLLLSRGGRRWTKATVHGREAVLTRRALRCPGCGRDAWICGDRRSIPKAQVLRWAAQQTSLFAELERELELSGAELPEGYMTCPHCGGSFPQNRRKSQVTVERRGKKLILSVVTADLRGLLAVDGGAGPLGLSLPLTEQLTFHFGRGRAVFSVTGADGTRLLTRDVTDFDYAWTESRIYALLSSNRVVRRRVRRGFEEFWGGKLPFSKGELTVERYILMTRFQGYPRAFYSAIPFCGDTMTLDSGFRGVARRLRRAVDMDRYYEASGLPKMKSLRRFFFTNPGLFFYLPETAMLWKLLEDPNLFVKQLSWAACYDLLLFFRESPGALQFFRDYKQVMGKEALLRELNLPVLTIENAAIRYCAMSPRRQALARKYWKNGGLLESSLPLRTEEDYFPDQEIDGYSFLWLRSTYECRIAGKALHNCLVGWSPRESAVVAVKRGKYYEAAIEVCNGEILQARAERNDPINWNSSLNAAVEKWKKLYTAALCPATGK